jgi:predicted phosphodiesterase
MVFRVVSDTHFEHWLPNPGADTKTFLYQVLPWHDSDPHSTLILAGDISSHPVQRRDMLNEASARFKEIIYVAGNHEHYGGRLDTWNEEATALEAQFNNVHISRQNEAMSFEPDDLQVLYATMWAPYGKTDPLREMKLNNTSDCHWIQKDVWSRRSCAKDYQEMYTKELDSLRELCKISHSINQKCAVVTHHVPSLKMRHPRFPEDVSDDMFMAPEAEAFMYEDWAPKFWFFGHTHKAWDIQIGNTRCISNPYGYPNEQYQGWVSAKIV